MLIKVTFSFQPSPHSPLLWFSVGLTHPPPASSLSSSLPPGSWVSRLPADKADQCWKRLLQVGQICQTRGDAHTHTLTVKTVWVAAAQLLHQHDATWVVSRHGFHFHVCKSISGANTSRPAGQPSWRTAQAEPGHAGPGAAGRGGQAGERWTRGSAGILQGDHLSELCKYYDIFLWGWLFLQANNISQK